MWVVQVFYVMAMAGLHSMTGEEVYRSEAAAMMASDFESLTAHLGRNRELKMVIKEMREEALETDGLAVGHVDWAENMPVKVNIF